MNNITLSTTMYRVQVDEMYFCKFVELIGDGDDKMANFMNIIDKMESFCLI